jgi:hypothetical protein
LWRNRLIIGLRRASGDGCQQRGAKQNEISAELPALFAALRLHQMQEDTMRYALLWLVGVPIPVLVVLYLLFH